MLAKVPAKKHGGRGGFKALLKYITDGKDQKLDKDAYKNLDDLVQYMDKGKVSAMAAQNVTTIKTASREMADVAEVANRKGDPVYHFVLSWPEHENPTDDQAFDAARHALKTLGMAEHQAVFSVHRDTKHAHVHVAVNRINPNTFKAVHPHLDYIRLDRACREIELSQGWTHDNGPMRVIDINGEKIITRDRGKVSQTLTPEESLNWWQVQYENVMEYAQEDGDITKGLERIGPQPDGKTDRISLNEKGERTYAKASKRDPKKREESRVLRRQARESLYKRYREETHADRENLSAERKAAKERQRTSEKERLTAWRSKQTEAKQALYAKYPEVDRRALASIAAAERAQSKEALFAIFKAERAEMEARYAQIETVPDYHAWCQVEAKNGNEVAAAVLRGAKYQQGRIQKAKERAGAQASVEIGGPQKPAATREITGLVWHITRRGHVSYRFIDGQEAFIDLGNRININEAVCDRDEIAAALKIASEKWGGKIRVTGPEEWKRQAAQIARDIGVKLDNPELVQTKPTTREKAQGQEITNDLPQRVDADTLVQRNQTLDDDQDLSM